MSTDVTIGGERIGSGEKSKAYLHNYERSTHDLSYTWRSSMSAGTLVPFMSEIALPGDTFDIDLFCDAMTLPTIGPLFGSYKVQLDIFEVPIRLYNAKLHMNLLDVGMNMGTIYLPQVELQADASSLDFYNGTQINPSCIFSYLNIRGLGRAEDPEGDDIKRQFNAVPYLAYWDIFKNYYANKQEKYAYVITNPMSGNQYVTITKFQVDLINNAGGLSYSVDLTQSPSTSQNWATTNVNCYCEFTLPSILANTQPTLNFNNTFLVFVNYMSRSLASCWQVRNVFWSQDGLTGAIEFSVFNPLATTSILAQLTGNNLHIEIENSMINGAPQLYPFELAKIDKMRLQILSDALSVGTPYVIDSTNIEPYCLPLLKGEYGYRLLSNQEGLAVKTYQSDLFNNWIESSQIDSVTSKTKIDTSEGFFTMDALNLTQKVYNLLNRVAVSGGTYDDWLNAVYTHERVKGAENPIYQGSLIKELSFEEVISTADSTASGSNQPLGTMAGRGRMTEKNKGGKIVIRANEPSYIMGIVSLTPRVEYSQGNKWDVNLKSFDDFHKPALDEIGYQDLITDQLAYFDTICTSAGLTTFKSAGKQPAWINYMTNVPVTRGNFAEENSEMFMTLNRRYTYDSTYQTGIQDVTTYIDPTKFNTIFAQSNLDAQNFWMQIFCKITARRKMSAKVIPNL